MHHSHMLMIYFYALKMQHILLLCNSEILEVSAWLSVLPSRHLRRLSHRPKYLDSLKSIILRQICCQKIIATFLYLQRERKFYVEIFWWSTPKEAPQMNYEPFPGTQHNMNPRGFTGFRNTYELYGHFNS